MCKLSRLVIPRACACLLALIICGLACPSPAAASPQGAPFTLEELFTPPWPFGIGARSTALSDDGRFVACGWNDAGNPCSDLWALDRTSGEWEQLTDFWTEVEARQRREFTRQLERDRQQWEESHPAPAEGDSNETGVAANETIEDDAAVSNRAKEELEFDADKRITEFEEDLEKQRLSFYGIGEMEFRRGSHELLYTYGGSIWSVDLDGARAPVQVLRHEQAFHDIMRVKDSDDLLLNADNDAFLWHPDGRLRQLTFGGWSDYDNTSALSITADERWLATVRRDYMSVRKQRMPDLLGDDPRYTEHYHVRPGDTPENVKLVLYDLSAEPPWPIEVELPEEPYYQVENLDWDPSGEPRLLVTTIDKEGQQYRAYLVTPVADAPADSDEYELELLFEEEDYAWLNWSRTGVRWAYASRLLLQTEHNGIAGLYELLVPDPDALAVETDVDEAADGEAQCESNDAEDSSATGDEADGDDTLDDGAAEDEELEPTHMLMPMHIDHEEIISVRPLEYSPHALVEYYYPGTACKALGLFNLDTWELAPLTPEPGWNSVLTWTEDEALLAYSAGDERHMGEVRLLDLAAAVAGNGGPDDWQLGCVRSRGDTAAFDEWAANWDVRFIQVPVRQFPEYEDIYREGDLCGGLTIAVKLHLPPGWHKGGNYPLLVWAHGAGYSQDVIRNPGWYVMLHEWLASERGWICAEVDYRGSEGYGRDWRVDVAGRLGHPEVEDLVAVKRFMVDEYGADAERTALWGWSYGGFLTLMALGLAPGEFPVGCAVAPVNRWENYFYWYSTERLGNPADHPKAYDRSAAETFLENITDNLLIVHGLRDDNTLFQSVAQYIEQCHDEDIDVELLLFPSDSHGISNDFHYVDVFTGMIEYIERHWEQR